MANILIIEDNSTLLDGITQVVRRMGHQAYAATNGEQGLALYERRSVDFVITDLKMDGLDGMEVLKRLLAADAGALVMIITAHGTIETAVEAMKNGAFDFITKPFPPDVLRLKIEKAIQVKRERERLQEENVYLRGEVAKAYSGGQMIGDSEAMQRINKLVRRVAGTDSTVYIYGESGTGKELVARALHEASHRQSGPFIKVNCGALAESVLESELFGHEKGAFTGAVKRRLGRFELADGGTLFLDEIGDVSAAIQLKLLRVLQEREFERVGGTETVRVDVRVVSATNKDMKAEVDAGRFREDLFYRLHIIPITLPPLRERREDVPALVKHFIGKLAARTRSQVTDISADALQALSGHKWPGNVRELENVIEQALVFAEGAKIERADLPPPLCGQASASALDVPQDGRPLNDVLEDLERQLIVRAFIQAEGVKTETARILGIKTSALYYKLEKYGVDDALLAAKAST
jgi:two-component system, NtrC family, response regulator HydG